MILKTCLLLSSFLVPFMAMAQGENQKISASSKNIEVVYRPRFNGELSEYIAKHLNYPEQAKRNGIQGKCVVAFMVDEKGAIQRIEKMQSSGDALLDAEAERVVASMPNWKPGTCNKRPVRSFYSLPINFELQ